MSTFIAAIAKAANVSVSKVQIVSAMVSGGTGARRILLPSNTLVVQFQVADSEHLNSEALSTHSLVQKITWKHAHKVHVRRVLKFW